MGFLYKRINSLTIRNLGEICYPLTNVNQIGLKPGTRVNFVVIGGGLNGAAAAFQLSELVKGEEIDATITLLERGRENLPTGSSAGETRITRKVSFENPDVIPEMVELSNAILMALGGVKPVPTILVGNNPRYLDNAVTAAVASTAPFSYLDEETHKQFSYVNTAGFEGILEAPMGEDGNGAGTINPTLAIERMLEAAKQNGVVVRFNSAVDSIQEQSSGKVEVTLAGGEKMFADKVIAAAGVWNDRFIGTASPGSLYTRPKVLKVFWFKLDHKENLADFPNLIFKIKGGAEFASLHPEFATKHAAYDFSVPSTEEGIYMLQEVLADGTYLKFGHIQPVPKLKEDPDVIIARENIDSEHEAFICSFVKEFMPGVVQHLPDVAKKRASFTKTYLEGFSNDFMPIIGPRFAGSNVVVMTGFSGIGAKFAVASGRYAALHALDKADLIPEKIRLLLSPDRRQLRPKPSPTWKINGNLGAPGPDGTVQSPPCLDMGLLGEKATSLYRNGYPANAGIPEARAAVANMFNRFKANGFMPGDDVDMGNVYIATGGATDAAQIAIEHARSKSDHGVRPTALLVTPVYHLYIGQLTQNGIDIRFADGIDRHCRESGLIRSLTDGETLESIQRNVTASTLLLFINSPRNPDGKIYSRNLLEGILRLLDDFPQLNIISDTIYKSVAPHRENVTTLFGLANSVQRRRIYETDGTSKSVAKTMDRAAWVISDRTNIEEIAAVSHLKRGRPALPQMLQIISMDEYLEMNAPDYCAKNSEMYVGKLAYVQAAASQVAGLQCSQHLGAYYAYLDFRAVDFGVPMSNLEKETALVDALIIKGVAVSAGSIFKHESAIRFNASFCNSTLQQMMTVIVETFSELGARVTRQEIPLPKIDSPSYHFRPYPMGTLSTHKAEDLHRLGSLHPRKDGN